MFDFKFQRGKFSHTRAKEKRYVTGGSKCYSPTIKLLITDHKCIKSNGVRWKTCAIMSPFIKLHQANFSALRNVSWKKGSKIQGTASIMANKHQRSLMPQQGSAI